MTARGEDGSREQPPTDVGTPPRTALEERVMRLWAELLSPPPRSVHDNFFELSGDSMKLIQFMVVAREEFGVELPAHTLFESALTVADIAAGIDEALRAADHAASAPADD